jgi:Sin3 histone deacetylase corepressor complex component SDS3
LSSEKKAAVREFEDKKVYLKEQLIAELEEKQKMIEQVSTLIHLLGRREKFKQQRILRW